MKRLTFPNTFPHAHPPVRDINEILDERASTGQRAADWVATAVGSWRFIIGQSLILVLWVILNVTAWIQHWDPYRSKRFTQISLTGNIWYSFPASQSRQRDLSTGLGDSRAVASRRTGGSC